MDFEKLKVTLEGLIDDGVTIAREADLYEFYMELENKLGNRFLYRYASNAVFIMEEKITELLIKGDKNKIDSVVVEINDINITDVINY